MAVSIGVEDEVGGVEGMKQLIDAFGGNLAAIARHLRVHRTSVLRVIQKYPELQEWLMSARHETFDDIENAMITAARNGCAIRQMFYLKTQGHLIGRPYQERPTDDELNKKGNDGPVTLEEWKSKRIQTRGQVAAMLEDFTIDGEAERID